MPWTEGDLPFSGALPMSRHCSYMGAKSAEERLGRQCLEILTVYQEWGPMSDAQMADFLGLERSTVNARRNELVTRGLVEAVDTVKNAQTGIRNTRWCLAECRDQRRDAPAKP